MSRFFIDRPIVAIVIAILTVVGGLVMLSRLPIAQYPDIVPPIIQVQTTYTGADALAVEDSVATPIEQQVNGVQNMIYMKSINGSDGTLTLQVSFEVGTDVNLDQVFTQNRLSQATSQLPASVNEYGLTVRQTVGLPLLVIPIYSPDGRFDTNFLGNYATINVNDELARVPGVGQVTLFGASSYSMRVWVRPDTLAKLQLTVTDLINAIKAQNVVNPAGQVGAEPAPSGQEFTYNVTAKGRLVDAEQFGEIIVRANPDGSFVRLRDVARIELGAQTYMQIGRFQGKPAAVVAVYQSPGSNALATADALKTEMERLAARFPAGLAYAIALDTTLPVSEGIDEIVHTLVEAMVLVIVVVFLFLQGWRATLIPLIAVPVSLIGAFIFFPMLGFSINTLSLLGLVLAIGLVVDDAIVVVEAVEVGIEHGLSPRDATIKAMDEVSGPVVGIALILAAVFIPAGFMTGITGRLYQQFAITIAISVLISAFNALTLSPALSALLLRPRQPARGPLGRFFEAFNRGFARATEGYVGVSAAAIRRAARAMLFLAGLGVIGVGLGKIVPTSFVPSEDQGFFFMQVSLPDAASLQRTDVVTRRVEEILGETEGIQSYSTIVGYSLLSNISQSYAGFYFVQLTPWHDRGANTADAIMRSLNQRLSSLPGAQVFAFGPPAIPGIGNSGGFDLMLQDRSGRSVSYLAQNTQRFLEAANQRPELSRVITLFRPDVPQIYANVNTDKVYKLGVNAQDVYSTLQALLGSAYVNQFNRFGRVWKVFLQAEPEFRVNAEDIGGFFVRNKDQQMVPLSTLVTSDASYGPAFTNRYNLYRSAEVLGSPAPGYSSDEARAAVEEVARQVLPSDMTYAWTAMSYQEEHAGGGAGTFALSIFFVFLILAALYESWSLPWSVLLTTPIAVFGAFLGIWMRRLDSDVFSQVGLIMLIGLVAKNAILIVEFAKAELEKGERGLVDAALTGAKLRLRPILMTSFAFILGCVPLWTASGSGAISRQSIGTTVITGMLAATGIAIFLVPVLFVLVERFANPGGHDGGANPPAAPGSPTPPPAPPAPPGGPH
ncbi:MAG TPA: multidrug efflux RND transporter permease subunit [Myxococcota bacterium]|nr:multidrug efflux RND transporter permease subunit [Myxococcota bacterium]